MIELIGFGAMGITMMAFLPQAWQVWRTKSVEDVSLLSYALLMIAAASWLAYGFLIDDWPVILTNVVLFSVQASIVACKLIYGKKTS